MSSTIFEQLHQEGLISDRSLERVRIERSARLFSVHWELKTILYAGILLLTGGLGILIYENIDSIGHEAILISIILLCAGCFFYTVRIKPRFSTGQAEAPNGYFDYIVLLGCLLFLTLIAYLQAQYNAFGTAYGLATFIPMVVLFFCAYYFDHLGILCMAITNLGAWLGIAVTPLRILQGNDFADARLIFAALGLGLLLVAAAVASKRRMLKTHFSFTYLNFGMNILYIATLAGMFHFDRYCLLWAVPLAAVAFYFYKKAIQLSSFYFILMMSMYCYIGLTYLIYRGLFYHKGDFEKIIELYIIASGVLTILFLVKMNKKLRRNDSL